MALVKTWLDGAAVATGLAGVVYLLVVMIFVIRMRDHAIMATHGSRFIAIMCVAGAVHIIASTVAHRHSEYLELVEVQSCVLWGYWLPYMAVGFWFACQYLQTLTYTVVLSRMFTQTGARRVIFSRPLIGTAILLPPLIINTLVSLIPNVAFVDPGTQACASQIWAKLVISFWIASCIALLAFTIVAVRRSFQNDAVREMPRQSMVLVISVAAAGAQAFVIVIAGRGLDDVANRFIATATITIMYVLAIGILAHRPLWKIRRGNDGYVQTQTFGLQSLQQPVKSVIQLLDLTAQEPKQEIRLVVSDFIDWVARFERPRMSVSRDQAPTHPSGLAALYASCDYYTYIKMKDIPEYDVDSYGNRFDGGHPPLFASDARTRTAKEIVTTFFEPPNGEHAGANSDVGPLHIPQHIIDGVMAKCSAADTSVPPDIFVPLLWWILSHLDAYFGDEYLATAMLRSDMFLGNKNVRLVITDVYRKQSQDRFGQAGIDLGGIPTSSVGANSSSEDDAGETDQYYAQQPGGVPIDMPIVPLDTSDSGSGSDSDSA